MDDKSGKKKKLKCYIYTRVSTWMQVDGYSLDAQRNRLIGEAEHRGMIVAREFTDEGKSGKNTTGRPEFTEMIRLIGSGNPDDVRYVLVFKLSRFGRNAADVLSNLQLMQDNGVDLICVEDGIDSASPAGKILFPVLAGVAELERENIQAQTKAGRQQKAREGRWNGGQAPLGYRIARDESGKNSQLVIDEKEAELVRLIFDKYVHSDLGYSGVAKWLNDNGYRRSLRQNRKYALFADFSVKCILDNPVYAGKIAYGRFGLEKVKGERNKFRSVKHDKYEKYEGRHEAIIPEELWLAAQAKRKATAEKPPKHYGPKHLHLLSGIVRCPGCGSPMYGRLVRKRKADGSGFYPDIYYYSCKYTKGRTNTTCAYRHNIRQEALDEEVIAIAKGALGSIEFNEDAIAAIGKPEDLAKLTKERDGLLAERKRQAQKKTRLFGKIRNLDADSDQYDVMYDDLQEILMQINGDISALDGRIEELESRIRNAEEGAVSAESMFRIFRTIIDSFDIWPEEDQRDFMHMLFERIEILPEPRPGGQQVKSVRFKLPVSFDGKPFDDDLDVHYEDDDDDSPTDDDPPSGGGTPPKGFGSPPGGIAPQPEIDLSGGGVSYTMDSVPNPNTLPLLSVIRNSTPARGLSVVPVTSFWMTRFLVGWLVKVMVCVSLALISTV